MVLVRSLYQRNFFLYDRLNEKFHDFRQFRVIDLT